MTTLLELALPATSADRVRRVQLAILTSGFWDVLEISTYEREDQLMLLG